MDRVRVGKIATVIQVVGTITAVGWVLFACWTLGTDTGADWTIGMITQWRGW